MVCVRVCMIRCVDIHDRQFKQTRTSCIQSPTAAVAVATAEGA